MFIEWNKNLEIGDPVVDSEHRYLIQLINNFYELFEKQGFKGNFANVFTHLARYVRTHFENEESLMVAIAYPDLENHRKQHEELIEQSMELSEQYLDGSETIRKETLIFLKDWALHHISETDMKIRAFLKGERPPELTNTPAYADSSRPEFKKCTLCGKTWQTFDDLKHDSSKSLKGCQMDSTNHLYNLILFNCSCETTLAVSIRDFATKTDIPFIINKRSRSGKRPSYCLKTGKESLCLEKCACSYTQKILTALR